MRSASNLKRIRPQPSPEQLVSWLKLHELARFDLSTGYVERAVEELGREVAEDEKLVVEPPEADEPLVPCTWRWCQADLRLRRARSVPIHAAECRLVL